MKIIEKVWREDGHEDIIYWNGVDVVCAVHGLFHLFDLEDRKCPFCHRETIADLRCARVPIGSFLIDVSSEIPA